GVNVICGEIEKNKIKPKFFIVINAFKFITCQEVFVHVFKILKFRKLIGIITLNRMFFNSVVYKIVYINNRLCRKNKSKTIFFDFRYLGDYIQGVFIAITSLII